MAGQTKRRLTMLLAFGALPLGCVSCVITGWPPLPPTTYHGLVVDPYNRPVERAEVTLCRPDKFLKTPLNSWLEDTDQKMVTTYTDRDGRFMATTRSGYATLVLASAPLYKRTSYQGLRTGRVGDTDPAKRRALPKRLLLRLQ